MIVSLALWRETQITLFVQNKTHGLLRKNPNGKLTHDRQRVKYIRKIVFHAFEWTETKVEANKENYVCSRSDKHIALLNFNNEG